MNLGQRKIRFVAAQRYTLALYDRDWDAAERAAPVLSQKTFASGGELSSPWPRLLGGCSRSFERRRNFCTRCFYEGTRTTGGRDHAVTLIDAGLLAELGLIDAGLGRKEEALNEGRRAMELGTSVKD